MSRPRCRPGMSGPGNQNLWRTAMQFTDRAIGLLTSGIMCALLAAFVLWQYRKRRIARVMAFTTFFMAGFFLLVGGPASPQKEELALLWLRIFMPFAYLLLVSFYRFSMLFARLDNRWTRGYFKFSCALTLLLTVTKVFNLSNGAKYVEGQGWFPANDPVYAQVY